MKTSELDSIIGSEKLDEKDDSVVIDDPDYIPPRGRKPKKHSTVMLELPRIWSSRTKLDECRTDMICTIDISYK